jgi:hypothetical protein
MIIAPAKWGTWQNAEKARQRRSRLESILNVARGYASGASVGCGLAERPF